MAKKNAGWSLDAVLKKLSAVPAPLKTEADAEALDAALDALEEAPTEKLRIAASKPATAELVRVIGATLKAKQFEVFEDSLLAGVRMLAVMARREGTDAVRAVTAVRKLWGSFWWASVMDVYGAGHPHAAAFFEAIGEAIPGEFLGIAVLDAANAACREQGLKKHPFDSAAGQARLAKLIKLKDPGEYSYAVSACASLPFLAPRRRTPLMKLAAKHPDSGVGMELAWALAKLGKSAGVKSLVEATKNPNTSSRACDYLGELGLDAKVPAEAKHRDFAAMAAMCDWLSHPNEYGEPPSKIGLFDSRVIYWPPAKKKMRAWLFEYTYGKSEGRKQPESGVGIAGPMLFAMFEETKAHMTPETLYGLYCELALAWDEDKRAPKERTGKKGWALISKGGK